MVLICICYLCKGGLDFNPDSADLQLQTVKVCSTRCGHLFHKTCIDAWWKMQLSVLITVHMPQIQGIVHYTQYTCPLCGIVFPDTEVFQVYMSFADPEEDGDTNRIDRECEELKLALKELELKNEELIAECREAGKLIDATSHHTTAGHIKIAEMNADSPSGRGNENASRIGQRK